MSAPWPVRSVTRCLVCGFREVRTDEVESAGLVLLGECPRCQHRWTRRLPPRPAPDRPGPGGEEIHAA